MEFVYRASLSTPVVHPVQTCRASLSTPVVHLCRPLSCISSDTWPPTDRTTFIEFLKS